MSTPRQRRRAPVGQIVVGAILVVGLLPYLLALRGMAPEATWIPLGVVGLTLALALANLGLEIRRRVRQVRAQAAEAAGQTPAPLDEAEEPIEEWGAQSTRQLAWVMGMTAASLIVGLLAATVVYIAAYLLIETQLKVRVSLAIVALYTVTVYIFFIDFLSISPSAPSLIW